MAQKFTSAATSINQTKLPAIYNKVNFEPGSVVIDYGCGKYTDHIKEKMNENNIDWYGYDLYNQPEEVNNETLKHTADTIVCANVLNVIDDDATVIDIVHRLFSLGKEVVIQIYEGNKSGVGKQTGPDQYQRNAKTNWYADLIKKLGYSVSHKGNIIYGN